MRSELLERVKALKRIKALIDEAGPQPEEVIAKLKAKVFTRLLENWHGVIPTSLRERIFDADLKTIDVWIKRARETRDLQAIFNDN